MILAWCRTNRSRVIALLAVVVFAAAVWFVIQYKRENPAVPLKVVLVRREAKSTSENVIQAALEKLLKDHNASGGIPLVLDPHTPSKNKSLANIYNEIKLRDDVVAVIDNSWGRELKPAEVSGIIKTLRQPVIFLNGDRFEEKGEDQPWVFLGTADHIPKQIVGLVNKVRESDPKAPIAFLLEQGPPEAPAELKPAPVAKDAAPPKSPPDPTLAPYAAAEQTRQLLTIPDMHVIDLACGERWQLVDRNALMIVRSRLVAAFPESKSDKRKIIIAFTHSSWGGELIRWIDSNFRATTIVAYQSAVSSDRPIPLREDTGNQLILLGQNATAAPAPLLALHTQLATDRTDLVWNQSTDIFFLRRAVVAYELFAAAMGDVQVDAHALRASDVKQAIAERVAAGLRDLHGRVLRSRLGLLEFDAYGVERGNNHISLRQGGVNNSYPLQLAADETFLPNLQVRVSRMRVTELDIRQSSMRIAFVLHVTCDPSRVLAALPPPDSAPPSQSATDTDALNKRIAQVVRFGEPGDADFSRALVGSKSIGELTEMQYTVSGEMRLPDMKPWRYPFDSHLVAVPINIAEPSSSVRVSIAPQQSQTLLAETDGDSSGWTVRGRWVEISHRAETAAFTNGSVTKETLQAQFSVVLCRLLLHRKPWSAIVLVYLPLLLIALGSTSILFIRLGDSNSTVAPSEVLKTQSELCLGCLLAVVTYLISYAGLVPRMERPLYCDALLGLTLLLVAFNFIFIVAFAHRENNPLLRYWNVSRYRAASAVTMLFIFGLWPALGFL